MTGGQEELKKGEDRGFAGLSSLVSDVDMAPPPPAAKKDAAATASNTSSRVAQPSQAQSSQLSHKNQEPTEPSSGDSYSGKWLLGIVVVGALLWLFSLINKNDGSLSSTAVPLTQGQKNNQAGKLDKSEELVPPKFNDYVANMYVGPRAKAQLVTDFDKNFKTRIRNTQSQSINFAGEYVLSTWGCGMDCLMGVVVSARTGQVVELPGSVCCWKNTGEKIIFKKNSRILVLAGLINESGQHGAHFYEFKDTGFVHIKTIPVNEYEPSSGPEKIAESPSSKSAVSALSSAVEVPQELSRLVEAKPPVGSGLVLSDVQIRYCLAEDIRMDSAKSILNSYNADDIGRFNRMVADYNSRCSSFRYRSGALESVRRDLEQYRSRLQSEGKQRFSASQSTGSLQTTETSRSEPDVVVQAIQRKLNDLGYKVGAADGLVGRGTHSAIIEFQQDRGLAVTGVADQVLLLQLHAAPARTTSSLEERPVSSASTQLSSEETESLEAVCSTDKYVNGPAAYRSCVERHKANLAAGIRRPDLGGLSPSELQSIEAACSTDKFLNGPSAYNQCLSRQLKAMSGKGRRPDLSRLSNSERESIEAVCSTDKYVNGPSAYNRCLNGQLSALEQQGGRPDLTRLSVADKSSVELACSADKYVSGPAAYNRCLSLQLAILR